MAKIAKLESLKKLIEDREALDIASKWNMPEGEFDKIFSEAGEKFYTFKKGYKWYVATKVDGKRVAKILDKNYPNKGIAQRWCDTLNRDYRRHGEVIIDNFLNYEADEEI